MKERAMDIIIPPHPTPPHPTHEYMHLPAAKA